jgi:hypothetical protein
MANVRKPVKDDDNLLRGFVEETIDGKQIALDCNHLCKGYYDPVRDITMDRSGKTIA